ncbi:unnamed protein product, partial [Vitis vinifera]
MSLLTPWRLPKSSASAFSSPTFSDQKLFKTKDRLLRATPVVDAFDPRLLVAPSISHTIDFAKIKEEELYEIEIPLKFISLVGSSAWISLLV